MSNLLQITLLLVVGCVGGECHRYAKSLPLQLQSARSLAVSHQERCGTTVCISASFSETIWDVAKLRDSKYTINSKKHIYLLDGSTCIRPSWFWNWWRIPAVLGVDAACVCLCVLSAIHKPCFTQLNCCFLTLGTMQHYCAWDWLSAATKRFQPAVSGTYWSDRCWSDPSPRSCSPFAP